MVSIKVRCSDCSDKRMLAVVSYLTLLGCVSTSYLLKERVDLRCSFWQDNGKDNLFVLHTFDLLGSLEKWHLQDISITTLELAQKVLEVRIPTDPELVLPAAEEWIPRLQLQACLAKVAPEPRCADVANVVGEVRVYAADGQIEVKLLCCRCWWVVKSLLLPLYAREVVLQSCTPVFQPISLLGCQISSPVANFNVAFQQGGMDQRFGKVVSYGHGLLNSSRYFSIWPVSKGGALLLGIFLLLCVCANNSVVWNVSRWEFQIGLLFQSFVGRSAVCGERKLHVLFGSLLNGRRNGLERCEERPGDGKSELVLWSDWSWESNTIEFGFAAKGQ